MDNALWLELHSEEWEAHLSKYYAIVQAEKVPELEKRIRELEEKELR